MLLTWYTLRAVTGEWQSLRDAVLVDAYSQHRDELSLAFDHPRSGPFTLNVVLRPGMRLLFRNDGHGRAKRNTASLFEPAVGKTLENVRVADRDRVVWLDLEDDLSFRIALFGPKPNVWLIQQNTIEAFSDNNDWVGLPPPADRPAPEVADIHTLRERLPSSGSPEKKLSRAFPLFDQILARELIQRADIDDLQSLLTTAHTLENLLENPEPRIYWRGSRAETFSLIPLSHVDEALREEIFDSVDDAVRVFSHRLLSQERFDTVYIPLEKLLRRTLDRMIHSEERMLEELSRPSRADTYERYGHLLMAQAGSITISSEEVVVQDLLSNGEPITIPVDPLLTAVQNAEKFYDRARRTRASRQHAEERWTLIQEDIAAAQSRLDELHACQSVADLQDFEKQHADALRSLRQSGESSEREPFHRAALPGGFEAWIGKSARDNAELITRFARPHDLWLHARDVTGSHVIIRRSAKNTQVPKEAIERAAQYAAHFSKAKTSGLVPVQVAERKFVRPIKGGAPGLVRVDREEVLLVEPLAP